MLRYKLNLCKPAVIVSLTPDQGYVLHHIFELDVEISFCMNKLEFCVDICSSYPPKNMVTLATSSLVGSTFIVFVEIKLGEKSG